MTTHALVSEMSAAPAPRFAARLGATLLVSAGLFGLYLAIERPACNVWGATDVERGEPLPGDAIVPAARAQGTRALTIQAPAAAVWAWLSQLGQDRAGFYSYTILENLVGCRMPRLTHLDPALQSWHPGDKLWMYPPEKWGGAGHADLVTAEPGHALAFGTRQFGTPMTAPPDGSWAFVVWPIDASTSRLLIRDRAAGGLGILGSAFNAAFFDPAHFAMERRTMESIKALAEGRATPRLADDLQVLLWTFTFVGFCASAIGALRGRAFSRRIITLASAGLLFQLLTLIQPSLLVGFPLVVALFLAIWLPSANLNAGASGAQAWRSRARRPG